MKVLLSPVTIAVWLSPPIIKFTLGKNSSEILSIILSSVTKVSVILSLTLEKTNEPLSLSIIPSLFDETKSEIILGSFRSNLTLLFDKFIVSAGREMGSD